MAVVSVVASVNGEDFPLQEVQGNYEESLVAPQVTSEIDVTATDDGGNSTTKSQTLYVTSTWLPPKTDWVASDYFNYIDYNRIMYNLIFLHNFAKSMYYHIEDLESMGNKRVVGDFVYASDFNAIEDNVVKINEATYQYDIGEKHTYFVNGSTPTFEDFNRIEGAILRLYQTLKAQYDALTTMPFTLGGEKGIRC